MLTGYYNRKGATDVAEAALLPTCRDCVVCVGCNGYSLPVAQHFARNYSFVSYLVTAVVRK